MPLALAPGRTHRSVSPPHRARRRAGSPPSVIGPWLAQLLRDEARAGLLLALAALAAVCWASIDAHGYVADWSHSLGRGAGVLALPGDGRGWVNDGAMTLFFLVVGLELSRALVHGELRDRRTALVPVAGALGGMAGAAIGYLAVAHSPAVLPGVGVPTATDVAFALGALGVLGRRIRPELRLFVLVLAVADDLGSLAVLVLGYSSRLELARVTFALVAILAVVALRRARVSRAAPYLLAGLLCWGALVGSGVEPALAGVVAGLAIPPIGPEARLIEHRLRPVVNGAVLPVFALANAGIALGSISLHGAARSVLGGLLVARVAGKAIGITLAAVVAARLLRTTLPGGARVTEMLGVGAICGVGFTVPLLVAARAFSGAPTLLDAARAGLLLGSLIAFVLGALVLVAVTRRGAREPGPSRAPQAPG